MMVPDQRIADQAKRKFAAKRDEHQHRNRAHAGRLGDAGDAAIDRTEHHGDDDQGRNKTLADRPGGAVAFAAEGKMRGREADKEHGRENRKRAHIIGDIVVRFEQAERVLSLDHESVDQPEAAEKADNPEQQRDQRIALLGRLHVVFARLRQGR
jgi:hypothetical protein